MNVPVIMKLTIIHVAVLHHAKRVYYPCFVRDHSIIILVFYHFPVVYSYDAMP